MTFTGEVHPVADLFPMLADDDLDELAADIKTRGLLQPIVLDADGRLLDGRNRLEACSRAKVEPAFTTFDGDDADGYALAVNIARRHLTKGQQAMVAAFALSRNGTTTRTAASRHGVSKSRISLATVVLSHAPDLADAVVSGAMPLDAAADEARQRKATADSTESQLAELRSTAPDLADLVAEERMSLAEARAAATERDQVRREGIQRCVKRMEMFCSSWHQFVSLQNSPERDEVLDAMAPSDREIVLRVEKEITWKT